MLGPGDVVVGGGVGEHCVVEPTFCFGLVELESDVGKRSGGCVEGVGDAPVMREERDIIHVRGDEDCDVVRGKRKGDLVYGVRVVSRRRRLPLRGSPWGRPWWW